jgi:hypothetical protein
MRKTIGLLVGLMLVFSIIASVSVVALASAGKPDDVPPPLEKMVFIHYRKGFSKPEGTPGNGPPPKEEDHSDHYALLGKGVKWKTTPVSYVIDPDNPQGLGETFIVSAVSASAEEWDAHTTTELFNDEYTVVYDATFDTDAPDGRNEVLFGDYPRTGVIAVTVIWGYFSGPPWTREIIEFDIMFDTDWIWGDATVLGDAVMDLQNIATHEFGHGAGLDDYNLCELETMYGYADYGETIKRDLYTGDIAGIQDLYG